MTFWVLASHIHPAVWIPIYATLPICFNLFNVRRYGKIEFWLTTIKVIMCVDLIILGLLLAMGVSNDNRLLGTDAKHNVVPCSSSIDSCVGPPGFGCMASLITNLYQTGRK